MNVKSFSALPGSQYTFRTCYHQLLFSGSAGQRVKCYTFSEKEIQRLCYYDVWRFTGDDNSQQIVKEYDVSKMITNTMEKAQERLGMKK